jgi:hypothetical protein
MNFMEYESCWILIKNLCFYTLCVQFYLHSFDLSVFVALSGC